MLKIEQMDQGHSDQNADAKKELKAAEKKDTSVRTGIKAGNPFPMF